MKNQLPTLLILLIVLLPKFALGQTSFSSQTTPTTQLLWGISFADTSIGYACGASGTLLKTTNGGTNWTSLTSGTTADLNFIRIVPGTGGQQALAVGDDNTILKTVNGGTTWTPQTIPFAVGSFVFGIQIIDSVKYFACGGDYATTSGAVLKTTNGGVTWTKSPIPGTFFLEKILMKNDTTGITVGSTFFGGSIHQITQGNAYTPVYSGAEIVTGIWATSSTSLVAVGIGGPILKSTDDGYSWTNYAFNGIDLYAVEFTDSLNGYACGGGGINIILNTTNGGITWTQIPFTFNGLFSSICIIGDYIYMAGEQGKIIKSKLPPNTTGINQMKDADLITVYPNPASRQIKISVENSLTITNGRFILSDGFGDEVKNETITSQETMIDIYDLPAGCYFYQLISGQQPIKKGKIIIE
jgi:photosystem II stability/assembly factor-like uncharacterized protein